MRELIQAEQALGDYTRKHARHILAGVLGNNAGTVDHPTRTNFVYVRLHGDANQVVEAEAIASFPHTAGIVVAVELVKRNAASRYQVLGIASNILFVGSPWAGTVGEHATQHQRRDLGEGGFDPLDVYNRALVNLRGRAQATPNFTLYVERGFYFIGGVLYEWTGGNSPAFTVPAGSFGVTVRRCDLLYIGSDQALHIVQGATTSDGSVPPYPTTPYPCIPVAFVYLTSSMANIQEDNIKDARVILTASDGTPVAHNLLSGTHGDTLAGAVAAGDLIIGNDTPKWARLAISVPAAGVINFLGVANGETLPSWKSASSNPGAAPAILATNASGILQLAGLGIGIAPTYVLDVSSSSQTAIARFTGTDAQWAGCRINVGGVTTQGFIAFDRQNVQKSIIRLTAADNLVITGPNGDGSDDIVRIIASASTTQIPFQIYSTYGYGSASFYGVGAYNGFRVQCSNANSVPYVALDTAATSPADDSHQKAYFAYWGDASAYASLGYGGNTDVIAYKTSGGTAGYVGIKTISPDTLLHLKLSNATTNAIDNIETTEHASSGTPAAGFGAGLRFGLQSSTTANQDAARLTAAWVSAIHASRTARLALLASDSGGEREGMRIEGDGSVARIGFYGVTAVVRPTALTTQLTTLTYTAPGTPDYAIQDFAQNGGAGIWGFADHDEANSVLSVIANLQTRVGELETKLQGLGLLT